MCIHVVSAALFGTSFSGPIDVPPLVSAFRRRVIGTGLHITVPCRRCPDWSYRRNLKMPCDPQLAVGLQLVSQCQSAAPMSLTTANADAQRELSDRVRSTRVTGAEAHTYCTRCFAGQHCQCGLCSNGLRYV